MTSRNQIIAPLLAVIFAALIACTGTDTGERPRYQPPSYASPTGTNDWEVNCGPNRVIIDDSERRDFYRDDGTQKTQSEVCDEMQTQSRIKRR